MPAVVRKDVITREVPSFPQCASTKPCQEETEGRTDADHQPGNTGQNRNIRVKLTVVAEEKHFKCKDL